MMAVDVAGGIEKGDGGLSRLAVVRLTEDVGWMSTVKGGNSGVARLGAMGLGQTVCQWEDRGHVRSGARSRGVR